MQEEVYLGLLLDASLLLLMNSTQIFFLKKKQQKEMHTFFYDNEFHTYSS